MTAMGRNVEAPSPTGDSVTLNEVKSLVKTKAAAQTRAGVI